ncbi:MAG TPA: cytochrome ubiquinol oxidase subunit I [Candidatus Dormibacteraeota bacterium]|nr:cytochrome ubiquinol oxidase subunit I [Candidatus Dormibacteraeota bacterium]
MSALLALIAPALQVLATQLPAQAPQGHDLVGAQVAIGSLFSLHILIAGLVSGAAELGPAIEFLGYVRQRRNYDRLAHGLGRFITYYFSVSSTIAILLITVLLVGFWGHFWTTIVTIGWWPLFIEAWTFVLQVSLAYLWYYTWEPMRAFKGVHMAIGGLLAIASFLQVFMIDVIASYMLTPTNPQNPVRLALNPTSYPLTVHRTVGNLAYIGFAFAGFCAIRYLRSKTAEDKRFYDWAGSFGLLWGVSMTLLQPVIGYSYAKEIQLHSYGSWYKMMFGTLSPVFLWQITLLGIMFLTATIYFARRLRTDEARGSGILKVLSVGMLLTVLLAAQPYHLGLTYDSVAAAGLNRPFWEGGLINPLGSMIPWKVLALMFYTLIAIAAVVWYLRGLPGVVWGTARRGEQRILMLMTVFTMMMMVTMGFIRENSRGPFLISGEMTIQGQQDVQTAQPTPAPPSTP